MSCTRRYVDIRTGRFKVEKIVVFLPVSSRVEETPFSQLWRTNFGAYPKPDWRIQSRTGLWFGGPSPNYAYNSVYIWETAVLAALDNATFDELATTVVLKRFMDLLNTNPFAAGLYASGLLELANAHFGSNVTTNELAEINPSEFEKVQ